jgi:predicted glycoside hydrolase/deacetylase ChbG (UPF0249 family)
MAPSMRLLIVNADDFGLNDAANAGIIETHRAGAVTSTTLMANAPAAETAAHLAAAHPSLGVGLHFNLTWGRPLSDPGRVPALIDATGQFHGRDMLARRALTGRLPGQQVALELAAQWRRLLELGIQPTHVDSHQHVHAFAPVFSAVATHCAQAGIPMRVPWVASERHRSIARRARRALLATLLARSTSRWRGRVRWNDGMGSVFDIGADGQPLDDSHYRAILEAARGDAFELMVHPVNDAAAMEGFTRVGAVGEAEWRYLRTGGLAAVAAGAGFRVGSYRDLHA